MDQQSGTKRTGVISIVVALVLVSAFWGTRIIRKQRLADLRSKAKPGETLAAIKPPAGTKVLMAMAPEQGNVPFATVSYSTDLDCETIKAYYRKEFPEHGFAPKELNIEPQALGFCGSHYNAILSCKIEQSTHTQLYIIFLQWTDNAC